MYIYILHGDLLNGKLVNLCIIYYVLMNSPFIDCIIIIEMLHKTLIFFCNFKRTYSICIQIIFQ